MWGTCGEHVGNYSLVLVRFSNGEDKYFLTEGTGVFSAQAVLPSGLSCSQCVLQWRYIAGNNWGVCGDGEGRVGCGQQEEFRACADISISSGNTGNTGVAKEKEYRTFWKEENSIAQEEKSSWNTKIDRDKNSYKYSLAGKNSYSFFSLDISPSKVDIPPSKVKPEQKKKDSKKYYFNTKVNKNRRRKLKAEVEKKAEPVRTSLKESVEEKSLYKYSLREKGSRSHAYFWSGASSSRISKPLHQSQTASVSLCSSSSSSPTDLLTNIMDNIFSFQRRSKLLTKTLLCEIFCS